MRKFFRQLLLGLATLALCCGILPAAFAASPYYAIELDPCGGTVNGTTIYYTNYYGKLTSLPTPTLEGYIFDGWYTDVVEGERVRSDTVFIADSTIYARWIPLPTTTTTADAEETDAKEDTASDALIGGIGAVLILGLAGGLVVALALAAE